MGPVGNSHLEAAGEGDARALPPEQGARGVEGDPPWLPGLGWLADCPTHLVPPGGRGFLHYKLVFCFLGGARSLQPVSHFFWLHLRKKSSLES